MQSNSADRGKLSDWRNFTLLLTLLATTAAGCNSDPNPPPPKPRLPHADARISLACADAEVGGALARRADAWAKKNGVSFRFDPRVSADTDVVVIRPAELGAWAAKNDAKPVPEEFRDPAHPAQWSRLLPVEGDRLASWAGEARAVPLAGETYLILYRTDRFTEPKAVADFQAKFRRPLAPPTTWDEFAELAEFFADRGSPSLPAVSPDGGRLLREFHLPAACYDRPAVTGTALTAQAKDEAAVNSPVAQMLAFHDDLRTGRPRLTSPAFVEAAKWLQRVARCRGKTADPAAAVADGSAVLAVVSLRELGRLAKDGAAVPAAVGVAPLPGSKVWFDAKTGQPKAATDAGKGANFVPYYGADGWVAVVRDRCPNPAAAFDLLADLSRLERSTELLSDPTLGFGPFRVEHLDQAHETMWQRYGFDEKRSRQLADAVRRYADVGLANPVVAARGSDQAERMAVLARELAPVAAGTGSPEAALAAADAAWQKLDAARPAEAVQAERRHSIGLR